MSHQRHDILYTGLQVVSVEVLAVTPWKYWAASFFNF